MSTQTQRYINYLIELINRATPDSLNIATSILNQHQEINIPKLALLRDCVDRSLKDKANSKLSDEVRAIKKEIVATLARNIASANKG